ncbi:MAG: ABC transporter substrate-binding protein [Nitrospirae bacterium]|nr:ABC transporter substrate-binding protein [Nitrospirota bacterium]MBI5695902.1 ABC transporter substrate-binding protein [Nitrospirota bacterium]
MLSLCAAVVIAALTLAVPASCRAGVPTETVKATTDKVISVLQDPALKPDSKEKERRAQIKKVVATAFDFEEMAKRSLAVFWKDRTPAEKKEFVVLFTDLLERSYINRIDGYSGEKIVYDSEKVDDGYASVKTHFLTKRREEIPVEYKLLDDGGKWMVYDVVIENVGLVNNYRIKFNQIIRNSSYADLVKRMKNKSECDTLVCPTPEK